MAATAMLYSVPVDATPAREYVGFGNDSVVVAAEPVRVATGRRRGIVVELKPRTFTETANHFRAVATRIDWPLDEADVD